MGESRKAPPTVLTSQAGDPVKKKSISKIHTIEIYFSPLLLFFSLPTTTQNPINNPLHIQRGSDKEYVFRTCSLSRSLSSSRKKLQKKLEKPPSKFPTSIYGYLLPLHSQENPQRPFSAPRPSLASPQPFAHLPVNLASSASLVCRSNVTHPNNLIRQERLFAASSTTLILRTVQVPSHDPSSDS